MKKITAIILAAIMMLAFAACGGSGESDPNCGLYVGETAEMLGFEMSIDDVYDGGFTIELKDNGKCRIEVSGTGANGKWAVDGTDFTVSGGGFEGEGTLENGVIVLEDVQGTGVNITFVRSEG